jgi:molybdate transport system substrate-binding protein
MLLQHKGRSAVIGFIGRIAAMATFVVANVNFAAAAELKVFSTIAVRGAVEELAPQFEKAAGSKLTITWSTAALLLKRVESGEAADALVLTRSGIETLSKGGKIAPGSEAVLARSGIAIAVKAGTPKPDISTPEALKQTLLSAKSIAYSNPASGGASGVYFAGLLESMGITEAMKAKTKYPPPGGNAASLLMTGEAELAVQQKPEIMQVAGAEVVGLLPGDLNKITEFAAAIGAQSKAAGEAKALIKLLQSPEAAAVFLAKGFDPNR